MPYDDDDPNPPTLYRPKPHPPTPRFTQRGCGRAFWISDFLFFTGCQSFFGNYSMMTVIRVYQCSGSDKVGHVSIAHRVDTSATPTKGSNIVCLPILQATEYHIKYWLPTPHDNWRFRLSVLSYRWLTIIDDFIISTSAIFESLCKRSGNTL